MSLREMGRLHPHGAWAVRTGGASGICVLDAEGGVDDRAQVTGVEVLDDFESWTNGVVLPPTGLIASTPSGGVHRYYCYAPGVRSKNRILPGVDLKSDGGYVLVPLVEPATPGRAWISQNDLGHLGDAFTAWLAGTRSGSGNGGGELGERAEGYDYKRFLAEGCPGGSRDEFFNELLFRMRKAGVDRGLAVQQARIHWKRVGQPGVPPGAKWYMPWHHVEGKMEHVWRTVEPDDVAEELVAWARSAVGSVRGGSGSVPGEDTRWRDSRGRASRVTIAPRSEP